MVRLASESVAITHCRAAAHRVLHCRACNRAHRFAGPGSLICRAAGRWPADWIWVASGGQDGPSQGLACWRYGTREAMEMLAVCVVLNLVRTGRVRAARQSLVIKHCDKTVRRVTWAANFGLAGALFCDKTVRRVTVSRAINQGAGQHDQSISEPSHQSAIDQ